MSVELPRIRIGREEYLRVILDCEESPGGDITARALVSGTEQAELRPGEVHSSEFVGEAFGVWVTHELHVGPAYWFTAKAGTVWLASPRFTARLDATAMVEVDNGTPACTLSGTVEVIRARNKR